MSINENDSELTRFTKELKRLKAKRARKVDIQGVEDRIKFIKEKMKKEALDAV